jgi:dTDP-4-dehydrorhamnose 3,5-epimerase
MGKLMRVTHGAAFLVAVDIRKRSPTLGEWFGMEVSAENKKQIWAPYGFARGFCALTDGCEVQYKCTGIYNPQKESGIYFADPAIGVRWPIDLATVITSEKDCKAQSLAEWLASPLAEHITYEPAVAPEEG